MQSSSCVAKYLVHTSYTRSNVYYTLYTEVPFIKQARIFLGQFITFGPSFEQVAELLAILYVYNSLRLMYQINCSSTNHRGAFPSPELCDWCGLG